MEKVAKLALPQEYSLYLRIADRREIRLICTPEALEELVTGFLYNEGLIDCVGDIVSLQMDAEAACAVVQLCNLPSGSVETRPSGLGGVLLSQSQPLPYRAIRQKYSSAYLQQCAETMQQLAVQYQRTGGMHCSALFDNSGLIAAYEDIGRHNTLDKLAGHCLLRQIAADDTLLLTSGRISADMVRKAARIGASMIASYTTPTLEAYEAASAANITLAGYIRREQVQVYCAAERMQ